MTEDKRMYDSHKDHGNDMTYENEDPSLEGSMVSYLITLSFQELEPLFNDDYFTLEGIGF